MQKKQYLIQNYKRFPVSFVRGRGVYLWDAKRKKYLDMLAGVAVMNLGHGHKAVCSALVCQARELWHTSNYFHIAPQEALAKALCEYSFAEEAFFCSSGAEANEAAIKLARKYGHDLYKKGKHEIIAFENSFHGRTYGALSATGKPAIKHGFGPLVSGFVFARFNDIKDVRSKISAKTCAVILELVQGEGGVHIARRGFIHNVARLCKKYHALLIVDEVQTGMGRCGTLFAYEHYGIKPDIMTLAKGLGNGFPIGALLTTHEIGLHFNYGTHGATFGGNFLASAVGLRVLKEIGKKAFLRHVQEVGEYLLVSLKKALHNHPYILKIRGKGLMIGIECADDVDDLVKKFLQRGIIVGKAGERVIRLLPPLIITKKEIDIFVLEFKKLCPRLE
ncbi:MAG: acetylornithine aminotransferase (ACOAT) [Parcubacteria group bacterium GW2011_GWA2_44_12]|nr:MAG: acetylornithine aminotransferase (ACOAT) [Parcubacteria group bacterium GW2011_GWA2_44_12]